MLRSLLRFSIRDVLWLTLVVGLAVGWIIDHSNLWRKAKNFENLSRALAASFNEQYPLTKLEITVIDGKSVQTHGDYDNSPRN